MFEFTLPRLALTPGARFAHFSNTLSLPYKQSLLRCSAPAITQLSSIKPPRPLQRSDPTASSSDPQREHPHHGTNQHSPHLPSAREDGRRRRSRRGPQARRIPERPYSYPLRSPPPHHIHHRAPKNPAQRHRDRVRPTLVMSVITR
jgi:hypothetical protein